MMRDRARVVAALLLAASTVACGRFERPGTAPATSSPPENAVTEVPSVSADSGPLPTPFTADQIRDEWTPGLQLTMRRWTPDGDTFERWRVVAADQDGVDIEFATVDGDGSEVDEPVVRHSTWAELRDHASYPESKATRTREGRVTTLGDLEGWLYTVDDPDQGSVSEFFFADSLPGAPIQMTVRQGDRVVLELEQIARQRPALPAPG